MPWGVEVTPAFKAAVGQVTLWQPRDREAEGQRLATGQAGAEVGLVPNAVGPSKPGPTYRLLAIREPLAPPDWPGLEAPSPRWSSAPRAALRGSLY